MTKSLLPLSVGPQRVEITGLTWGVFNGSSMCKLELRGVTGSLYAIPFFFPERDEDENGNRRRVWTFSAELAAARLKAVAIAAADGVTDRPDAWNGLDSTEVVEPVLVAMERGQHHLVEVRVTEVPTKGRIPMKLQQYAWSPVPHALSGFATIAEHTDDFPHQCPRCNAPAYVGLYEVAHRDEASATACPGRRK